MSDDRSSDDQMGMQAKEDSSLTLPLTIIGVTLLVSLGFLYYYFGPSIGELTGNEVDPTTSQDLVKVTIQGTNFTIPGNHMRYPKDRRGGARERVALYALLPKFAPYSESKREIFESESVDSPVIYFEISGYQFALDEAGRFDELYREHIVDLNGHPGPDGLTMFEFDGSTGYKDEDVFTWDLDTDNPIIIRCYRKTPTIPMPDCRRDDAKIAENLVVSYRFKRHWLAEWRKIDKTIHAKVQLWMTAQAPTPE